ncbi:hypothetical protein OG905_28200 [Streptomyces sp. NBC_00322]|uniref:hypothetical protein n=1 Tax=Streptomyces sp. NBC_00322 TaxID=2975712 RepID=UPI002E2A7862|nr:hypothetical protein [Streptomyces sp. NBC_00322]
MALWMSWEVSPIASAGEDVGDIEGAVQALDQSVQRIQERAMSPRDAAVLHESARVIHDQMLSDGRAAVERGERWTARVGEVEVTLIPRM